MVTVKETDICVPLVKHLVSENWEVYQEVVLGAYSGVADIVAVKKEERLAWIIEVKLSIGQDLRYQLGARRYYSPYVAGATPYPKRFTQKRKDFIEELATKGIGFYHVHDNGHVEVVQLPDPAKETNERRYGTKHFEDRYDRFFHLPEECKTFCLAGSAKGGYLTPFKITCMNIKNYVEEHPGCSLREAVLSIEHHYSSDDSAISSLYDRGVKGVEFRTCLFARNGDKT